MSVSGAVAGKDAEGAVGRDGAGDAAHRAHDTRGRAVRRGAARDVLEEAAVAGAPGGRHREDGGLPAHGRRVDDWHSGEGARVGEEEARGEVVGGVDDDCGAGNDGFHRQR